MAVKFVARARVAPLRPRMCVLSFAMKRARVRLLLVLEGAVTSVLRAHLDLFVASENNNVEW